MHRTPRRCCCVLLHATDKSWTALCICQSATVPLGAKSDSEKFDLQHGACCVI